MSLYLDASAFLKRYLIEPDGEAYGSILAGDHSWVTARHTSVEVRRNLARNLEPADLAVARRHFEKDWALTYVVELSADVCEAACAIAEVTGVKTLDALHLAAAHQVGPGELSFVTADAKLAKVARSLGWTVLGS